MPLHYVVHSVYLDIPTNYMGSGVKKTHIKAIRSFEQLTSCGDLGDNLCVRLSTGLLGESLGVPPTNECKRTRMLGQFLAGTPVFCHKSKRQPLVVLEGKYI